MSVQPTVAPEGGLVPSGLVPVPVRRYSVANLGFRGTLVSLAANSVTNAVLGTLALEGEIAVGSLVDATLQTFVPGDCQLADLLSGTGGQCR